MLFQDMSIGDDFVHRAITYTKTSEHYAYAMGIGHKFFIPWGVV